MTGQHAAPTLYRRLLAALPPRRARRDTGRVTEDAAFLAMFWRLVRALEERTIERPENLPQVLALVQRFNEIVAVAVAENALRFAADPFSGASMAECSRALGIKKQSGSQYKERGTRILEQRLAAALDAAGVGNLDSRRRSAEAAREAAAITAAAQYAVVEMATWIERRASRAA